MQKIKAIFKRVFSGVVKGFYLLPFFIFGLWLLQQVYLPNVAISKFIAGINSATEEEGVGASQIRAGVVSRDHFHMVDEYVTRSEPNAPVCQNCHSTYAHSKNQKVRSLLNFHNGFMACAVCHTSKRSNDRSQRLGFTWVDRATGKIVPRAEGAYGKYSAKIFPVSIAGDGTQHIVRPVDEKAARQFLEDQKSFSKEQLTQAQKTLHVGINSKPIACADCHQKDGYLDFTVLGFSPQRIVHLNSSEVVGLIDNYKTFYMPEEIDFGSESDKP